MNLINTNEREIITTWELITVIKTIKVGKSNGPDQINNKLIKNCDRENLNKLSEILSMLFPKNKVPDQWKLGTVKSIYKGKGTRGNPKKDRGITLSIYILKIKPQCILSKFKLLITRASSEDICVMFESTFEA